MKIHYTLALIDFVLVALMGADVYYILGPQHAPFAYAGLAIAVGVYCFALGIRNIFRGIKEKTK